MLLSSSKFQLNFFKILEFNIFLLRTPVCYTNPDLSSQIELNKSI